MGKKSIKENKNIYQMAREDADLTRAEASEKIGYISESRLEKIESEKTNIQPEDVIAMAKVYDKPELCNHYCAYECAIGYGHVPAVRIKDISNIILELVVSLNTINDDKDRLMEIMVDGEITPDEIEDFARIKLELNKVSATVEALQLWTEKMINSGKLDNERLVEIIEKINK